MAMRYLAGKLRVPAAAALRRPAAAGSRSLSASAPKGGGSTGTTEIASYMKFAKNADEEIRLLLEEVAKLEAASREIKETIRRCLMGSAVLGIGLGGAFCAWYTQ